MKPARLPVGAASAQISASIGMALHRAGFEMSPDQFINAADTAMDEAKRAGKSRCWVPQHGCLIDAVPGVFVADWRVWGAVKRTAWFVP